MTETQPVEKNKETRHWVLQTLGLAFGLAMLMVVVVTVAVLALESPSNRRAAVSAAPISTATPVDTMGGATPEQSATEAPTAAPEPTQTPVADPTSTSAGDQAAFEISVPVVANQNQFAGALAAAREAVPTATVAITQVVTPVATKTAPSVARVIVPKPTAVAPRLPAATAAPFHPLDFSFYVKEYCATERSFQILQVMLTAHGGVPPYDYYNDATQVGQGVAGSVVVEVKAAYGNPVPFKLIVIDKTGQRYSETFFWKSTRRCSWRPLK
jgi:hypothetical protein